MEKKMENIEKFMISANESNLELMKICKENKETLKAVTLKITKVEQSVTSVANKLKGLETRVNTIDTNNNAQIRLLNQRLDEAEKSSKFVSEKYDEFKTSNSVQIETLKQTVDKVSTDLRNEQIGRNDDSQYFRSAFYVKIHGIPWQKGEESFTVNENEVKVRKPGASNLKSMQIIHELATAAGVEKFSVAQVDVCHRTSNYHFAPIIIMFSKKSDRENLYRQRHKLGEIDFNAWNNLIYDEQKLTEWRQQQLRNYSTKDWSEEYPRIVLRDYLTSTNTAILKEVIPVARAKHYKHCGYLSGGRIHVRKTDTSVPIEICTKEDITKKVV